MTDMSVLGAKNSKRAMELLEAFLRMQVDDPGLTKDVFMESLDDNDRNLCYCSCWAGMCKMN